MNWDSSNFALCLASAFRTGRIREFTILRNTLRIGAIKSLEHLRSACSHVGAIVLANMISVARVQEVLNERGECFDPGTEKAIRSVGTTLIHYIEGAICPKIVLEAMVREKSAMPVN